MTCLAPHQICLTKGQDNLLRLRLTAAGAALDLAGYQANFQLRESAGGAIIASLDSAAGGGIALESDGRIAVSIPQVIIDSINLPRIYHGLRLTEPGGASKIRLFGPAIIVDGIATPPYTRVP